MLSSYPVGQLFSLHKDENVIYFKTSGIHVLVLSGIRTAYVEAFNVWNLVKKIKQVKKSSKCAKAKVVVGHRTFKMFIQCSR